MVTALGLASNESVIEIGAGRGALTTRLLDHVQGLCVVEIDRDLVALLERRFPNLEVISEDVLALDLKPLFDGARVVGNLPYNISTPFLTRALRLQTLAVDMHFLLQTEVVMRLAAVPGTRAWGRLSVYAQYFCDVEALFNVGPECFDPPPRVDSTFVRLTPRAAPLVECNVATLERVTRDAFGQRRKRLGNALKSMALDWDRLQIDPGRRAETLDVHEFVALANAVDAIQVLEGSTDASITGNTRARE